MVDTGSHSELFNQRIVFSFFVHTIFRRDIMTQKELLYVEDAIGHEQNIIKIINESLTVLEDENLVSFMEKEEKKHGDTLKDLLSVMEDKSNE